MAVQRHKQAGHVAEALAVYDAEKRSFQYDIGAIFERNVKRLGKAQDACDRWLTDPDNPDEYELRARAEEVTVLYEETEPDENARSGFRTVKRKAKLHVLLGEVQERHGIRVTGFETKFADPRQLLVSYSAGLRGEMGLFIQSLALVEEKRVRELAEQRQQAAEAANVQEMFQARRELMVEELTAGLVAEGVEEARAREAAERLTDRTLPALADSFQDGG